MLPDDTARKHQTDGRLSQYNRSAPRENLFSIDVNFHVDVYELYEQGDAQSSYRGVHQ